MNLDLFINYDILKMDYRLVYGICIDYADNTLRGILSDGKMSGSEITLLRFSDYGIFLDNRYGGGYDITYVDGGLSISFKNKK